MGAYTEKTVYLRQKQGRNTHPERKGMGILSNEEEECSKSELSRDTHPRWSVGVPNERKSSKDVT